MAGVMSRPFAYWRSGLRGAMLLSVCLRHLAQLSIFFSPAVSQTLNKPLILRRRLLWLIQIRLTRAAPIPGTRIFPNFCCFWADFRGSKIPLIIIRYLKLTKTGPGSGTSPGNSAKNIHDISTRYAIRLRLMLVQGICAILLQNRRTPFQSRKFGLGPVQEGKFCIKPEPRRGLPR